MKKTILATLIASSLLAGCSSNGSSNNSPDPEPKQGIADVIYNGELRSAAIIGDEGNNAIIIADGNGNAAITVNGDAYTVQGDAIINDQGENIGSVYTENGIATAFINDIAYTLTVIDGRLIVDSSKLNPPTPDNDLPEYGEGDWGIPGAPTYGDILIIDNTAVIEGDNGNHMFVVQHEGTYYFNVNGSDARPTHKIVDGEVQTIAGESTGIHAQKTENGVTFRTDNGTEIVFRNDDGRLFAAVISRPNPDNELPGSPDNDLPVVDGGWGVPGAPTYGDILIIDNTAVIEGDNGNHMFVVQHEGTYYFNVNGSDARPTHKIVDGEVQTIAGESTGIHTQKTENGVTFRTDNGTEIIFRNEDGRLFAAVISRPNPDNEFPPTDDPADNENPFIPFTHNGVDLVLDTTTGLITNDGVVVASFTRDGHITGTVVDHATGNEYKIWKDANGINVDWVNSSVDSGWDHVPTPDNDFPPTDDPVDNENPFLPFTHNGVDLVLDTTTGLITNDGVVVASFTRDGYITGTVIDHATGNEYKIWKDANGINVDWVNSIVDSGWDHVPTPDNDFPPTDDPADNENPFIPFSHNGVDLVLDTTTGLITNDGVVVASFTRDGHITGTVIDHATGNEYKVWKDANGINVDWVNSTVDNGWGHVATPDNELPVIDEGIGADTPIWDNSDFVLIEERENVSYLIHVAGEEVARMDIIGDELVVIDTDGNQIASASKINATEKYAFTVIDNAEGQKRFVLVHKETGLSKVINLDEGVELPSPILTSEQKANLKERVQSLSVEQRQQIKQAIKTRLQARL